MAHFRQATFLRGGRYLRSTFKNGDAMQVQATPVKSSECRHETKTFVQAIKEQLADSDETKRLQAELARVHARRDRNRDYPSSGTPCIVLPYDVGLTETGFVAIPHGHSTYRHLSARHIAPVTDAAAALKSMQDTMSSLHEADLGHKNDLLGWFLYTSNVETRMTPAAYAASQGRYYARRTGHGAMRALTFPIWGAAWLTKDIVRRYGVR